MPMIDVYAAADLFPADADRAFGREEFAALAAKKKQSRRPFTRQSVMPTKGWVG